jgi:hypothetical protein
MTWIVGTPTPFGHAVALSDIKVTLGDNSECDCLQKIYPVGRFLALGFAGSVQIGFDMVACLSRLLYHPNASLAWEPQAVAGWWPQHARGIFGSAAKEEQDSDSQLMLLGVHPTEHLGNPEWPKASVHRFSAPDFEPVAAACREVVCIGLGTEVGEYAALLSSLSGSLDVLKFEMVGGVALGLEAILTKTLQRWPRPGVSRHLHVCQVWRGGISLKTNDHDAYDRQGRVTEFRMPLARIIHVFADRKSLQCYKHVVHTMFEAPKEALSCPNIPQRTVCCSPIFLTSRSWPSLISGKAVPTAERFC